MNIDEIIRKLKDIMTNHEIVKKKDFILNQDTRLIEDLGIDSVSFLELVTSVEEEFDITIDFEEINIEILNSAKGFANFLQQKINA